MKDWWNDEYEMDAKERHRHSCELYKSVPNEAKPWKIRTGSYIMGDPNCWDCGYTICNCTAQRTVAEILAPPPEPEHDLATCAVCKTIDPRAMEWGMPVLPRRSEAEVLGEEMTRRYAEDGHEDLCLDKSEPNADESTFGGVAYRPGAKELIESIPAIKLRSLMQAIESASRGDQKAADELAEFLIETGTALV